MTVKSLQRRHLEAIVAVSEHRSVHEAARQLGMAQPALSRSLTEAEAVIGTRLFARSSLGSRPTATGESLLTQARFVLRGLERIGGGAASARAPVRLGCIARGMHTLIPALLERIYPADEARRETTSEALRFRLVEGSTTALLDAASRGELDFAVVRSSGEAMPATELAVERLYDERTVIIAAASAKLPTEPMSLARLAEHDWVLPDLQTGSRAAFDRFWHEQGLAPVRPLIETRSFETNLALVAHTRFLSIAPESIAARHATRGGVRIVRTRRALPRAPVSLVFHPLARNDPTLVAFRVAIHDAAARARALLRTRHREDGG
ncbi:MAG: LysR substrate-binding domain-containing protein [Pseudomonadota bacterium]|nr:LysR substrate-binding domain-containing protein [Pseudomonadota bacterium]